MSKENRYTNKDRQPKPTNKFESFYNPEFSFSDYDDVKYIIDLCKSPQAVFFLNEDKAGELDQLFNKYAAMRQLKKDLSGSDVESAEFRTYGLLYQQIVMADIVESIAQTRLDIQKINPNNQIVSTMLNVIVTPDEPSIVFLKRGKDLPGANPFRKESPQITIFDTYKILYEQRPKNGILKTSDYETATTIILDFLSNNEFPEDSKQFADLILNYWSYVDQDTAKGFYDKTGLNKRYDSKSSFYHFSQGMNHHIASTIQALADPSHPNHNLATSFIFKLEQACVGNNSNDQSIFYQGLVEGIQKRYSPQSSGVVEIMRNLYEEYREDKKSNKYGLLLSLSEATFEMYPELIVTSEALSKLIEEIDPNIEFNPTETLRLLRSLETKQWSEKKYFTVDSANLNCLVQSQISTLNSGSQWLLSLDFLKLESDEYGEKASFDVFVDLSNPQDPLIIPEIIDPQIFSSQTADATKLGGIIQKTLAVMVNDLQHEPIIGQQKQNSDRYHSKKTPTNNTSFGNTEKELADYSRDISSARIEIDEKYIPRGIKIEEVLEIVKEYQQNPRAKTNRPKMYNKIQPPKGKLCLSLNYQGNQWRILTERFIDQKGELVLRVFAVTDHDGVVKLMKNN